MSSNTNLTQASFSGGIISQELFSRIDFNKLESGLKQCENWVIRPAGGALYRVGTKYITTTKYPTQSSALIPFVYNRKDGVCLEFGAGYIRFFKNGTPIMDNGAPYEIATTYTESEVNNIKYAQYQNDLYLVHPNHPPALLTRTSDTNWTLRDLVFNPPVPMIASVTITALTPTDANTVVAFDHWQYVVSVVDKDNQESLPTYSNVISSDIDLTNQNIQVAFDRPTDYSNIDHYNIYRVLGGVFYLIYELPYSNSASYTFKDISLATDNTKTPKESFTEFGAGNYPSAVGLWNQRLVFGNTQSKPSTFWCSRVGFYEDFTKSAVMADDDAIELTFSSGSLDAIIDFTPMDDLIVFTEGKIWRVVGTSVKDMAAYIESYTGSSSLKPFVSKKSVLFVDSSENTVSNFIYSYELNGYVGQNLDTLCREMFDGYRVGDITYKDTPFPMMYCIRNDGTLLAMTYLKEENIYAWHKHTTQGYFRNICSIDRNQDDQVYCVVERNGTRYVEMFMQYIDATQDISDSWHLDCASKAQSGWWKWSASDEVTTYTTYKNYTFTSGGGDIPESYGVFQNAICTVTPNEDRGDWVYILSLHFTNGTLPIKVYHQQNTLSLDLSYFTSNTNPAINSMVYSNGQWINAIAENNTGYGAMIWYDEAGTRRRNLDWVTATAMGWNDGHNTVYSDCLTYSQSGNNISIYKWGVLLGTITTAPQTNIHSIYIIDEIAGATVYDTNLNPIGVLTTYGSDACVYNGITYSRNSDGDVTRSNTTGQTYYKYTLGAPTVGGVAYDDMDQTNPEYYTYPTENSFILNGLEYEVEEKDEASITEVNGLERFEGQEVTVLADTNVYKNVPVEDGKITLEIEASSVLVGYPYRGIIETIPVELKYSSGNTTIGTEKKIVDGTLTYYRTRGLWYGRNIDHLYEIKPYTDLTYSDYIPLETGKLLLKVADGFNIENTFVVVQDNPLPALVQSITLGSVINGKN